mgnify:CR=1 FL=1
MSEERLTTRDIARNMEKATGDPKPRVATAAREVRALPMFAGDEAAGQRQAAQPFRRHAGRRHLQPVQQRPKIVRLGLQRAADLRLAVHRRQRAGGRDRGAAGELGGELLDREFPVRQFADELE